MNGKNMNKGRSQPQEDNQSPITPSLRLAALAAILTTVADAMAVIAALQAMDEAVIEDQKSKQEQKELDEKLEKMQQQIDQLTNELLKMKASKSSIQA